VVLGPYVHTVVQPPADLDRGLRVLPATGRALLALAARLAGGPPCDAAAATQVLRMLAPGLGTPPPALLTAEGFA